MSTAPAIGGRALLGGAWLVGVAVLTVGNVLLGGAFRVGFLYLPIVAAGAWWLGRTVALTYAAIASVALVAGDIVVAPELPLAAVVWNEFTRVVTLLSAAGFVSSLRHSRDRSEQERERMFRLAVTDPLTGLYNRRFLQEQLGIAHSLAVRHGRAYVVLAIDVDGMKALNDLLGHKAGDAALAALAANLRSNVRAGDIVVRTGGDEFVVLMPDERASRAADVAERMISLSIAPGPPSAPRPIGLSIGVAAWKQGDTPGQVLERADALMYESKRGGGTRCTVEAE